MAVSVSPSIPTESSTAAPAGGFSGWFKGIGDWLKSLSPAGATQYDTDWLTTGVTIPPETDWTVSNYRVRRVGKTVWIYVQTTYSGADFTTGTDGNMTDKVVATLPAEYRPTGVSWPVSTHESGTRMWGGSIGIDGKILLSHGLPSRTGTAGNVFTFSGSYAVA